MPRTPGYEELGLSPKLTFGKWLESQGHRSNDRLSQDDYDMYAQYSRQWETAYQQASQHATQTNPHAYEYPAEYAQRRAEEERKLALDLLGGELGRISNDPNLAAAGQFQQGVLNGSRVPYTDSIINAIAGRTAESQSGAATSQINQLRRSAASSGIVGGGTASAERGILEAAQRANTANRRDINTQGQLANFDAQQMAAAAAAALGATTADLNRPLMGSIADIRVNTEFELPETGYGPTPASNTTPAAAAPLAPSPTTAAPTNRVVPSQSTSVDPMAFLKGTRGSVTKKTVSPLATRRGY